MAASNVGSLRVPVGRLASAPLPFIFPSVPSPPRRRPHAAVSGSPSHVSANGKNVKFSLFPHHTRFRSGQTDPQDKYFNIVLLIFRNDGAAVQAFPPFIERAITISPFAFRNRRRSQLPLRLLHTHTHTHTPVGNYYNASNNDCRLWRESRTPFVVIIIV